MMIEMICNSKYYNYLRRETPPLDSLMSALWRENFNIFLCHLLITEVFCQAGLAPQGLKSDCLCWSDLTGLTDCCCRCYQQLCSHSARPAGQGKVLVTLCGHSRIQTEPWEHWEHNGWTDQTRPLISTWLTDPSTHHQPWQILKPSVSGWNYQLTDNKTSPAFCLPIITLLNILILLRPHTGTVSDLTEILTPRLIKILIKPGWHWQEPVSDKVEI